MAKGGAVPIRLDALARRVSTVTIALCLVPYLGLLLYLRFVMHATEELATVPSPALFVSLGVLGVLLPGLGLVVVFRTLVRERERFRLVLLLEAYVALVLIFASSFAILQASGTEPAISGVPVVWSPHQSGTLGHHLGLLHEVFLDSLYLSVITITTVGYGDMVPLSGGAKLLSALEGLVGIAFYGVALGHYFSVCVHRSKQ